MNTLKKDILSGLGYTAVAKYSGLIISFILTAILARLIDAHDFGIVAVAMVFIVFFSIYADIGISPAIIQYKDLTKKDLENIFAFTAFSGLVLALLFFAVSGCIGDWYGSDQITIIGRILSVNLLFVALNVVPSALLYKEKRFKFVAFRTLSIQLLAGSAAIIYALAEGNIYALLINPIVASVAVFGVNFSQYPQPLRLTLGLESLRKIWAYSTYQFFFNILGYLGRNIDKLLIGKFLSLPDLGFYEKSAQLTTVAVQNFAHVVAPVLHPIMSTFQNDTQQLEAAHRKILRILALIGFPLSVFLYFSATEATLIVFGSKWTQSIGPFSILALSAGFQIVLSTTGPIFQSAGATRHLFFSGLLSTSLTAAGVLLAVYRFGTIEAVACAMTISCAVNFFMTYAILYLCTFKAPFTLFLRQLFSPVLASAVVFVVLLPTDHLLHASPLLASLTAKALLSLAAVGTYIQCSGEYDLLARLKQQWGRRA